MGWLAPAVHHISPWLLCLVVGLFLLLESSGIPLLNSSLLLFAGAVASFGHVNIVALALAAITGSVSGACLAYVIGKHGGEPAMRRLLILLRADVGKIERARRWFSNRGARVIFLSRIVPYVRPFTCFFGGIASMPFLRFFIAACSGSIVWCVGVLAVGWMLGRRWRLAFAFIQSYTLPALGLTALAIAIFVLARFAIKRRTRRLSQTEDVQIDDREHQHEDKLLEV
jgi:membrane protein DedA with SNARE-associated domain